MIALYKKLFYSKKLGFWLSGALNRHELQERPLKTPCSTCFIKFHEATLIQWNTGQAVLLTYYHFGQAHKPYSWMIPSRRTTVGLILFQDTVNATMMKLFKIWCSRCHTECIDIYSAITSFPIFLPNQPMLMLQHVCRIQCGWGCGDWAGLHSPLPSFSLSVLRVGNCTQIVFDMQQAPRCWLLGLQRLPGTGLSLRVRSTQATGPLLAVIWV